jgi:predicted TIM-barrel fold metal-dependent hydrolase
MIDGHAFLGKSIYMEQSSGDLISKMDRLGLKATVVIAPPPGPFYEDANNLIRERAIEFPDRLIPIFRANPHLEGESERVRIALTDQGFRGIQLDPKNDGYGVGDKIMNPIIQIAKDLGIPVYIHSGDSIFCPINAVADYASRFEKVNFITNFSQRDYKVAMNKNNLYLMTRPFPTLMLKRRKTISLDIDKLIFTSDAPIGNLELELKKVELSGLEQEAKDKIFGGNLKRLIKIH